MQQPRRHFPFRIFALLLLSGLLPVLLGVMGGCSSSGKDAKKDGEIVVWVSGDTRGYLEPCGCRRDQAGGLPARMTLLQQDTSPHRLLVDVGNLTSGGRSYELLKLDFLLRGMATLHYDALNLGKREVNLDRDTLLTKIRNSHLPFVSCNVLDRQTGKSLTSPSLLLTVDGTRIGITGVVKIVIGNVLTLLLTAILAPIAGLHPTFCK